jgi:Lipase (class 3)
VAELLFVRESRVRVGLCNEFLRTRTFSGFRNGSLKVALLISPPATLLNNFSAFTAAIRMIRTLDKPEAFFYGQFVDAAYTMYERDPQNPRPLPQAHDIPDGYEMVAWIQMSDFFFWYRLPMGFYGLMARSRTDHHQYVVALRGTKSMVEWWDDGVTRLVRFKPVPDAGRVECGFDTIYSTLRVIKMPEAARAPAAPGQAIQGAAVTERAAAIPELMTGSFAEQLEQLADSLEPDPQRREGFRTGRLARPQRGMVVTGHSLGSALATLVVMENKSNKKFDICTLCTFASPRVGNAEFVRQFAELPITSWRLVNTQDIVPRIPFHIPLFFPYEHVETEFSFSSAGVVKWNPGCWHSMKTYLHWLDPASPLYPGCQK